MASKEISHSTTSSSSIALNLAKSLVLEINNRIKNLSYNQGYLYLAVSLFFKKYSKNDYPELYSYGRKYIIDLHLSAEQEEIASTYYKEMIFACISTIDKFGLGYMQSYPDVSPELVSLIVELGGFDKLSKEATIYNPFAGMVTLGLTITDYCSYYGEIYDEDTFICACLRKILVGRDINVQYKDEFQPILSNKYDGLISFPTFGNNIGYNEILARELYQCATSYIKKGGVSIIVLPLSTTRTDRFCRFRTQILQDRNLKMIVALPHLTKRTDISFALYVFENTKHDFITMVDASDSSFEEPVTHRIILTTLEVEININDGNNDYCQNIDYGHIQNTILTPYSYLIGEPDDGKPTTPFSTVGETNIKSEDVAEDSLLLSSAKLSEDYLHCEITPKDYKEIKPSERGRLRCRAVPANSYVLNIRDNKVTIGHITNIPDGKVLYTPHHNIVFRFKSDQSFVTEKYLIKMLFSTYLRRQYRALTCGSSIPYASARDFENLKIPYDPDQVQQERNIRTDIEKAMSATELELQKALDNYNREIHVRKHAISQNLSSLTSLWNALNNFRKRKGVIANEDMIGRVNSLSVNEIFESLDYRLKTLERQAEYLADVEYHWGDVEDIEPDMFFHKYAEAHKDVRFEFVQDIDVQEYNDFPEDVRSQIKFPHRALEHILDNIISNAVSHGFKDSCRDDYKVRYTSDLQPYSEFYMYISNNGEPLKDGFSCEDVLSYGLSTALNESYDKGVHSGIGGADIKAILNMYDAKVEIISTPGEEYTVTYKLTFKLPAYGE